MDVCAHVSVFKEKPFMCMGVLPTCMSVYQLCAWCPWRLEEDIRSPGTEITVVSCYIDAGNQTSVLKDKPVHLIIINSN